MYSYILSGLSSPTMAMRLFNTKSNETLGTKNNVMINRCFGRKDEKCVYISYFSFIDSQKIVQFLTKDTTECGETDTDAIFLRKFIRSKELQLTFKV